MYRNFADRKAKCAPTPSPHCPWVLATTISTLQPTPLTKKCLNSGTHFLFHSCYIIISNLCAYSAKYKF